MKILVTGGSRGIGKAIVNKYAANGHDVAFCSKNSDSIQSLTQELNAEYPSQNFISRSVDATDERAVHTFVADIISEWKSIDILINNAGIYIPGNIHEQSFEELHSQMNNNVYSAFHFSHAVIPHMKARQSGHIFNMCSIASLKAYPGGGAYSISKYALLGLNDNLRHEMQPFGVKVTALIPGAVYTDSWAGSGVSEERILHVDDIAQMVYEASLLSAQAVIEQIVFRPQLGDL